MAGGERSRFSAIGRAGFVEDVADVSGDGADGDEQFFGDLPIGTARRYKAQDLNLPLCQSCGINGGQQSIGLSHQGFDPRAEGRHAQVVGYFQGFLKQALPSATVSGVAAFQQ